MNDCAKKELSSPLFCKAAHAMMAYARLRHMYKAVFGHQLKICSMRMQEMSASQLDALLHDAAMVHNKMARGVTPCFS